MARDSIHLTSRIFGPWRCRKPAAIGLCLAFLGSVALWAQSAPMPSPSIEPEAAAAYRLGMSLVKEGHLDDAIPAFKSGLRTDPQNVVLLNVIGATYSLKGDFERAENYLLKSLETDPGFVPARKNLAINYFNLGKYDLATTEFQKLVNQPGA